LLATFLKQYAAHYTLIELKNTGHWVPEERPRETTEALVKFFQQSRLKCAGGGSAGTFISTV
jgi:pimeloyl-ACP methyl ester carboxylesterase